MSYSSSSSPPLTPPTSDSENEVVICPSSQLNGRKLGPHARPLCTPSAHPFAASTKADRNPPSYEKKLFTPPPTPPDSKKVMSLHLDQLRDDADAEAQNIRRLPPLFGNEQMRWDAAISSAVDNAVTKIDLSSANLKYIPSSIIDLKGLVVLGKHKHSISTISARPFTRSTTAPAILPSPHIASARRFLPSQTTNRLAFRAARLLCEKHPSSLARNCRHGDVELYLMRNAIRELPRELFALDHLVVLSLRQNKLTSLPPAINRLTGLRELNIANNRLTYLPAEIQDLRLELLHLHPNPFIPPPLKTGDQCKPGSECFTRILGPLTRRVPVPTLSELILRYLFSPVYPLSSPRSVTQLEEEMTPTQIDALLLPAHIRRIICASTGHGRAHIDREGVRVDAAQDLTRNTCPSPRHRQEPGDYTDGRHVRFSQDENVGARGRFDDNAPVFGVPVEERMEWVGTVAGVQVAESSSAWVPLLWRGCSHRCLGFLDREDVMNMTEECESIFESGVGEEDEEFEFSDAE